MPTALMIAVVLTLLLSSMPSGAAVPLSSFYSYGSAAGDSALPPTDDGSSPPITLPSPFRLYGTNNSIVYVSWFHSAFFICRVHCEIGRYTAYISKTLLMRIKRVQKCNFIKLYQ